MDRLAVLLASLALVVSAGEGVGAEPLKLAAPTPEAGNTYARAFSTVLTQLGTPLSYDQVMGLSGVAFALQIDTAGPTLPDGELDCAWWPNDAWGFDLGLPLLRQATGWELRKVRCDLNRHLADSSAEFRRALLPLIAPELNAGRPVLAENDHCFVITSVDADAAAPPILGYGTKGHATSFGAETMRCPSYPWGLYLLGERRPAADAAALDLASLRHIVALWNEQAQGPDAPPTRFSGRKAWAEWLKLLHAGQAHDNNMLIHLRYNRASAVAYLRAMARRHTGALAEHLNAAAALYQQVLDAALATELPNPGPTKGGPAAYEAMVERAADLEAKAIGELVAALAGG